MGYVLLQFFPFLTTSFLYLEKAAIGNKLCSTNLHLKFSVLEAERQHYYFMKVIARAVHSNDTSDIEIL